MLPLGIFAFIQLRGGTKPTAGRGRRSTRWSWRRRRCCCSRASFLALRLLLFVLHRLDGRIGRSRRLPTYLAGRRLGRSPGTGFAAALLLLLAMGLLVVVHVLPRDRAAEPQRRRPRAGGRRLERAGQSPRPGAGRRSATCPRTRRRWCAPTRRSATGASRCRRPSLGIDPATYEDGGWWRSDFSSTSIEDILERHRAPSRSACPVDGGTARARPRRPRRAARACVVQATVFDATRQVRTVEAPMRARRGHLRRSTLGRRTRLLSITFRRRHGPDLPPTLEIGFTSVDLDGRPLDSQAWEPIDLARQQRHARARRRQGQPSTPSAPGPGT